MAEDQEKARERVRRWKAANPEKWREHMRRGAARYRAKNPKKVAAALAKWARANPEKHREHAKRARHVAYNRDPKRAWLKEAISHARVRSRDKGLAFDMAALQGLACPDVCPILGTAIIYVRRGFRTAQHDSPSIDRFDPKSGYVAGNVRVVSHRANRIKGDASLEEFGMIVAYLRGGAI